MSIDELRVNLCRFIDLYVSDCSKREYLRELVVNRENVPVKGVLADLDPYFDGKISDADGEILKDIFFYFC